MLQCKTGRKSTFQSNKFISNRSEGFGGAMKIGSPDGGCHPSITSNTFQSNSAKLTVGAVTALQRGFCDMLVTAVFCR